MSTSITNRGVAYRLSVMMFLQYASLGSWSVTLGTYIKSNTGSAGLGIFDGDFIGWLLLAQSLGALFAPFGFGVLADRYVSTEKLLAGLHTAAAGCLCLMATSRESGWFFLSALIYFQVYSPTGALSSSLALRQLPGGQQYFAVVRSLGTVGWIAAGVVVGVGWRTVSGESIEAAATPMWLAVACHLAMAGYSLTLPHTPPLGKMSGGWRALAGGGRLWRNRSFVILIVLSALVMAPAQFYNGLVHPFLNQHGFQDAASLLTLGQLGEVIVMITLPWLLLRFRLKTLFLCGASMWVIRFGLFAMCDGEAPAVLIYPAILVHGFAFVYVYLTGQLYIDRLADPDARAAAQGVHAVAVFGVGNMIGALATGVAEARYLTPAGLEPPPYNWPDFWALACLLSLLPAVLFAVLFREQKVGKKEA